MSLLVPEKVTARHLERRAYVYVRQSTPKQVQQHQEGQRNQYALVQRARALGWAPERIQVIDADQGHSGRDSERRGFQELVAEVSLGHVGIILAYEASRLARNNADWYTLLDLASVVGALIADAEGIYDPRAYNDRLLLGLRGMLSEAEVHVLHQRMREGRLRQVERGDYRQRLPTGLLRRDDGRVIKDPDLQVQHTLELVFAHFAHLGSCQRVLRRLRDDGVLLPRRQWSGLQAGELVWRRPTDAAIYEILRSPAYAGAFVYGRHAPHPERRPGQTRMVNRPLEEWTAIHQGVYPAYISWEQFLANQARMSDNASNFAARTRGAPRQGQALGLAHGAGRLWPLRPADAGELQAADPLPVRCPHAHLRAAHLPEPRWPVHRRGRGGGLLRGATAGGTRPARGGGGGPTGRSRAGGAAPRRAGQAGGV
jgi:DNA invertase Pin-like site-specific DNA recombinase